MEFDPANHSAPGNRSESLGHRAGTVKSRTAHAKNPIVMICRNDLRIGQSILAYTCVTPRGVRREN